MNESGWIIDRDYINGDDVPSRVGRSYSWHPSMRNHPETVRFRALDDDGEVYYGGYLLEAVDGESTGSNLLDYVMRDAGAVCLQVREGPNEAWEGYMS